MYKKNNILPEITVYRKLPQNITEAQNVFFKDEITKTIPEVTMIELSHCVYSSYGLFKERSYKPISPFSYQSKLSVTISIKNECKYLIPPKKKLHIAGTTVTITDNFSNGYFHWFCDALPRLFVLKHYNIPFDVLILPSFCLQEPYISESLLPFNIPSILQLEPYMNAKLEKLISLSPIAPTGNYRPDIMKGLQSLYRSFYKLENNTFTTSYQKIYISRAKAPKRKVLNEDEIIPILKQYGYIPVIMEELSFKEQVQLIGKANRLVSLHGAGLTNMLFMPPASKILEFRFPGDGINNCYFSLSNALDFEYYYIIGKNDSIKTDPHKDNIIINPENLKKTLEIID